MNEVFSLEDKLMLLIAVERYLKDEKDLFDIVRREKLKEYTKERIERLEKIKKELDKMI